MNRWPWLWPLLVAVVANVVALGGAAWNRARVEATLDLTERELALDTFALGVEDAGDTRALQLTWQADEPFIDLAGLEALGFDCSVPPDDPRAERHYGRALPREVYLVLEQEGEAWKRWWAQHRAPAAPDETLVRIRTANLKKPEDEVRADLLAEAQREVEFRYATSSRLFVIAAGLDADALRSRYPDRAMYAIARGTVAITLTRGDDDHAPRLVGFVDRISTDVIHVERDLAPVLHALGAPLMVGPWDETGAKGPRYRARVAFGARHEPWLEQLTSMPEADAAPEG